MSGFLLPGKGGNPLQAESRWGASYPTQFRILLERAVRVRRFQSFSVQDITQFLVIGAPLKLNTCPPTSGTHTPQVASAGRQHCWLRQHTDGVHATSASLSAPRCSSTGLLAGAGVLAGLFWLQKGKNNTVSGAQQTIGLLFFELLFLSFRALFVVRLFLHTSWTHKIVSLGLPFPVRGLLGCFCPHQSSC